MSTKAPAVSRPAWTAIAMAPQDGARGVEQVQRAEQHARRGQRHDGARPLLDDPEQHAAEQQLLAGGDADHHAERGDHVADGAPARAVAVADRDEQHGEGEQPGADAEAAGHLRSQGGQRDLRGGSLFNPTHDLGVRDQRGGRGRHAGQQPGDRIVDGHRVQGGERQHDDGEDDDQEQQPEPDRSQPARRGSLVFHDSPSSR
nr:hypothetical protein [Actinoplanes sp. NBRC 103695]